MIENATNEARHSIDAKKRTMKRNLKKKYMDANVKCIRLVHINSSMRKLKDLKDINQ
jgi:hypothetical protein